MLQKSIRELFMIKSVSITDRDGKILKLIPVILTLATII